MPTLGWVSVRKEAEPLALGVCSHPSAQKQGPWAPCLLLGLGQAHTSAYPVLPNGATGRAWGVPVMALGLLGFGGIHLCGVLVCTGGTSGHSAGAEHGRNTVLWPKPLPESPWMCPGPRWPHGSTCLGLFSSPSQLVAML